MPKPTSKTPQRIERMIALHAAGASAREIAEELGLGHTTINGWMRDAGLAPNGGQGGRSTRKRVPPEGAAAAMAQAQKALAELTATPVPGEATDCIAELRASLALIGGLIRWYEQGIRSGAANIGELDKAMAVQNRLLTRIEELTPQAPVDPALDPNNLEAAAETRQRFASLVEAAERQSVGGQR